MRHVTMADPLGSRVLVIEGGRPRGGTIIGGRERVGEPSIHVKLDPLEESGPVEYRTLPASEVWIDTAALERWADAETRYRLAEELRRRAEDERERCTCGHSRRAHHAGGVDDGGCTACECTAYADQIERLTRERDEARAKVEDLRARAGRQLEIETRARDEARADAARLRRALEEATRALAVDPRYLSPARLGTARSILAAALAGEGEAPTCTWTMDEDGVWRTGCGASWVYFPGGTPDEHGQHFCHACGQRVEAEPHAEGEDEEPAPEVKGGRDA